MNNSEDDDATMSISKIFFFVISCFGLVPAIYQTIKGKQTVAEFVNNNRNFTTFQLSMTLIATTISLGGVSRCLQDSYSIGLNSFLPVAIGSTIFYIIMVFIIVPKLVVFFQTNHFGEAIEKLGDKPTAIIISLVVCCAAILLCIGQFKIGIKSAYFLSEPQKIIFLWLFGFIIALYIVFGGIRSVVNSDIIQLFFAILAIVAIIVLTIFYIQSDSQISPSDLVNAVKKDMHNFSYDLKTLNMFLIFLIPAFTPAYTSRFFLAKDIKQAQVSFIAVGIFGLLLTTILYITAKTIGITSTDSIQTLDIQNVLKSLKFIDNSIKFVLLMSLFMFAVTTIDSLVQFATVEIATIITNDKTKLKKLFVILPMVLIFVICYFAQDNNNDINYFYFSNLAHMFILPIVTPIIMFYCITGLKFDKSTLPLVGILVGASVTSFIYANNLFVANLNAGFIGGLANLLVLLTFKNLVKHERIR